MKKIWIIIFSLCFVFWAHLIFASRMNISMDARSYEGLGERIVERGFVDGYLKSGPRREPLYPLSIAFSMKMAELFGAQYQSIQKIFQVFLLFLTQVMALLILSRLRVREGVKMAAVLYIGLSPALINASMSLFSEIMSFPFVLATVYCLYRSWLLLLDAGIRRVLGWSLLTGLAFSLSVFSKGVFQYVYFLCLIPFVFRFFQSLASRDKRCLKNTAVFLFTVLLLFEGGVAGYKYLNKVHNGNYAFTNRFDWMLFGSAYKRSREVTPRIVAAHVANIPGDGVCRMFFTREECAYCNFTTTDYYGLVDLERYLKGVPDDERSGETLRLTFRFIRENPAKFILFMLLEAPKLFFWESTQIGFVNYPDWLGKIYDAKAVRYGVRAVTGLLTAFGFFYVLARVLAKGRRIFSGDGGAALPAFTLLVIVPFMALYSCYSILTRYALPVAPLYIICVAVFWDRWLPRKR